MMQQANPYYLTKSGYSDLKKEYNDLVKVQKPKVIKKIKEARAKGNLEENPELENVREEQMFLESKILEIEEILENAKVINTDAISSSKVTIGSTVTVTIDDEEETYQIVGAAEADPTNGKISYESPVGKSLLGLKPNDQVEVKLPHALLRYTVIKIHELV